VLVSKGHVLESTTSNVVTCNDLILPFNTEETSYNLSETVSNSKDVTITLWLRLIVTINGQNNINMISIYSFKTLPTVFKIFLLLFSQKHSAVRNKFVISLSNGRIFIVFGNDH
jgi:hypothetical protein